MNKYFNNNNKYKYKQKGERGGGLWWANIKG